MNRLGNKKLIMNSSSQASNAQATGRWNPEEHERFVEALKLYGKNWKKVEEHVRTRDGTQVRSHAQKYLAKLEKEMKGKKLGDKLAARFESASSMRNASGASTSTHHTQKENQLGSEHTETQLNANLPMSEVSRSSQNSTANTANKIVIPTSQGNKMIEEPQGNLYANPVQLPLFNPQMLPYMQSVPNSLNYLSQRNVIYPTIPFLGLLPPSFCVYMNLMKYLADCGRFNQPLKLSDFVDLSTKNQQAQEDVFEMPEARKKIKQE